MTSLPLTLRRADGTSVQGELLVGIDASDLDEWELLWKQFATQAPGLAHLEHVHWDWRGKVTRRDSLLNHQGFALRCDGQTQGLMLVETLLHRCRLAEQAGKNLAYVEYLEVAPWNLRAFGVPRLFGVGSVLLAAANALSHQEGYKGRMGLHSLPQSCGFYEHLGMTNLGKDLPYPEMNYFEVSTSQASSIFGA
ncbi:MULTISPECIES: GNAT family N-acetyltransferase [Xanthomonas]|uniref:GNAT family N-acetyltransferase n=1 Tax=Xanthomonas TaxID=338 RepID=UPI00160A40F7|nr:MULTISPECIES: GNAT family N-acetyltransferase [Xanthomonas]MBB6338077.1 hypothetical protein [Xanthomonas arboricola]MCE4364921.1 hypothetical protein [Xanthomonas hortorum]MDN0209807.1 GNAT family N-acetyltransferase [Xanthomonas arboricola pv. corylina]MDN0214122.1 GNAT family N-acetyltransferase [Xanthomonas arboricola pv. corylina]CAG2093683.1 GNAT family N-acetyltransferase [Xanthomonas euroxanthea]